MAKKKKTKKIPAKQRICKSSKKKSASKTKKNTRKKESKVGYKNPPKEHQFPPGQSGNPNGPPVHRIHLWSWFCQFMLMTDAQLKRLVKKKMTQVQHTALRLVEDMKAGKYSGSNRLARHVFDREEGRPVEHLVIEPGDILTDEECEEIRQSIIKNHVK